MMRLNKHVSRGAGFLLALVLLAPAALAAPTSLVMDVSTGKVLEANDIDTLKEPASLTKLMTLYLTFEALKTGKLKWSDRLVMSANAESKDPYKFAVGVGNAITVKEAVEGMIVISANDAAVAVAERLGGTEAGFGEMMTKKARELGMSRTTFHNPTGLPSPGHVTTARDMATLALALYRDFPKNFHYFGMKSMVFRGMKLRGHNFVMNRLADIDGMKTGYTEASGYSVVTSAERKGTRLIGVLIGADTANARDERMAAMVEAYLPGEPKPAAPHMAAVVTGEVPVPRISPMREGDTRR